MPVLAALDELGLQVGRRYRVTFDRSGRGWHLRPGLRRPRTELGSQGPIRGRFWRDGAHALGRRDESGVLRGLDDAGGHAPGTRDSVELVVVNRARGSTTFFEVVGAPRAVAIQGKPDALELLAAFSPAELQSALRGATR